MIDALDCGEEFKEWLFEKLWNTQERSRAVIITRLGLEDGERKIIAETSELFYISEDRVRTIEHHCFRAYGCNKRGYKRGNIYWIKIEGHLRARDRMQ